MQVGDGLSCGAVCVMARCPQMLPHPVLMRCNKLISFHVYEMVTTCTEQGVLSAESNGRCHYCDSKRDGEVLGKVCEKRQLVLKRTKYKNFCNDF